MNRTKAHKLLTSISRYYDLALRAHERSHALKGKTSRAIAERDKAYVYITKAADAEFELRELIDHA